MDYLGFWVTGGIDGGLIQSTTEIYSASGTWTSGPALPKALWGHCVVQLDNSNTLLVGGTENIGVRTVSMFSICDITKRPKSTFELHNFSVTSLIIQMGLEIYQHCLNFREIETATSTTGQQGHGRQLVTRQVVVTPTSASRYPTDG